MRKRSALVLLIVLGAAMMSVSAAPRTGTEAPDFAGVDSNGKTVRLSDFRGKVVVLEWSNHDCPYVRKHYGTGNMQSLQRKAVEKGVVWLSIVSSAPGKQGYVDSAAANRLTEERDASPTAVVLDPNGEIGRTYQATHTPHMFVIDRDGVLSYAGAIDDRPSARWDTVRGARNYVDEALDAVLAGRTVEVAATRAYGCTVKY
jgi:peroxiredoxin